MCISIVVNSIHSHIIHVNVRANNSQTRKSIANNDHQRRQKRISTLGTSFFPPRCRRLLLLLFPLIFFCEFIFFPLYVRLFVIVVVRKSKIYSNVILSLYINRLTLIYLSLSVPTEIWPNLYVHCIVKLNERLVFVFDTRIEAHTPYINNMVYRIFQIAPPIENAFSAYRTVCANETTRQLPCNEQRRI